MDYQALRAQVLAFLHQEHRVAYRILKRQFQLDDETLHDLKDDLIYAKKLAVDEEGRVLVWTGGEARPPQAEAIPAAPPSPEAERRQLTVLFCDLVDSTVLASQLDPEDLREIVRAYQDTCAKVIARFEGHIAQYLGDGLLVYFGYPLAHEDDAQRAVRAGLGMLEALGQLNTRLTQDAGGAAGRAPGHPYRAGRGGGHGGRRPAGTVGPRRDPEPGGPPARARRAQYPGDQCGDLSAPRGVLCLPAVRHPAPERPAQPLAVYRVLYESMARSRLEAAGSTGWTPLVGREQEMGLLRERWAQVKEGVGQVVLLSGEAGIGKSRLVQVLQAQVATEPRRG